MGRAYEKYGENCHASSISYDRGDRGGGLDARAGNYRNG